MTYAATVENMNEQELSDLAAACEKRLAKLQGRHPDMVIRLTLPEHEDDCDEIEPHDWVRMAASSAQLAGVALRFCAMDGVTGAVKAWLADAALDTETEMSDHERVTGVQFARDINRRVLRDLSKTYLKYAEKVLADEAAEETS